MMMIRFTKAVGGNSVGQQSELATKAAQRLIDAGVAVEVNPLKVEVDEDPKEQEPDIEAKPETEVEVKPEPADDEPALQKPKRRKT